MKKKELLEDLQPDNTQNCKSHVSNQSDSFITTPLLQPWVWKMLHSVQECINETSTFLSRLTALKLEELMAALKKKDDDMRAMEERYKMYLEKARNVSDKSIISLLDLYLIPGFKAQDRNKLFSLTCIQSCAFSCCMQVIRALDPKLNPATAEIQALRNQLAERDKQILNLEVNLPFDFLAVLKHSLYKYTALERNIFQTNLILG